MKVMTVHENQKPIYDIVFARDYSQLETAIEPFELTTKKVCIVSETHVAPHYLEEVMAIYGKKAAKVTSFVFEAGEASKNLETIQNLYEHLILEGFDRKDILVALGGGVTGDMTGYAAATYLRGIKFIQMPTSLLSQVDSSIGGKTGVDFRAYKNMVGAFHQPSLVYINLNTLNTLTEREYLSGMGEIIKHGLIKDIDYYYWLRDHADEIKKRDMDALEYMIYISVNIKRLVVENDPKEQGERALLNFGHTVGHAVEKLKNFGLLHGECVTIGMAAAAYISYKRGQITQAAYEEIYQMITSFDLPVQTDGIDSLAVLKTTKSDKKMEAGKIKFVLLAPEGHAVVDKTVTDQELLEAITTIQC